MAKAVMMPQVGQDVETGVIVEWRVKENDRVEKGDVIALVESDKATFEVEAYESGTLLKILYNVGEEAKVLEPIAYIGQQGEKIEQQPEPASAETAATTVSKSSEDETQISQSPKDSVSVSPSAKRIARQHDIDLTKIKGTGPQGRITKQDVLEAIAATTSGVRQPAAAGDQEIPFSKMRKRIADRLTKSKQTIPLPVYRC